MASIKHRGDLENEMNSISHRNISSLKTDIKEKWNKMSEGFILKACKSFRRRVDTIMLKKFGHTEKIFCFVSILNTLPVNSNRYVSFFINRLGIIAGGYVAA